MGRIQKLRRSRSDGGSSMKLVVLHGGNGYDKGLANSGILGDPVAEVFTHDSRGLYVAIRNIVPRRRRSRQMLSKCCGMGELPNQRCLGESSRPRGQIDDAGHHAADETSPMRLG